MMTARLKRKNENYEDDGEKIGDNVEKVVEEVVGGIIDESKDDDDDDDNDDDERHQIRRSKGKKVENRNQN